MKYLLTLIVLLLTVTVHAGKPPGGGGSSFTWTQYKWNKNGQYVASGNGVSFSYPLSGQNAAYTAFVIATTNTYTGNLTGKTVSAIFTTTVTSGNPTFVFGGQLSGWNNGPTPAHARLFISSNPPPYSNPGYTACPDCYWWSGVGWSALTNSYGGVTVVADFDPAQWSNAIGQSGSSRLAQFNAAVADVKQIGLAFGGGSFFDVGVAILNGTGNATFTLNDFTVE